MTITNRAFIKVYRQDGAEPTPAASATAAMRPAMMAAASIEYVASSEIWAPVTSIAGDPAALAGSIDVVGPPTQLAVDTIGSVPSRPRTVKNAGAARPIQRRRWNTEPPAAGKRPLSSFIAREHRTVAPLVEPGRPNRLRPGTTVASFHWPAVCRALSRQFAEELDRVAKLVSKRARQTRSLIGILGLFPGGGCSTVALCLAEQLSSTTQRTIVVDGNFCRPRLAAWLDAVPTAGWQEVLAQEAPLTDAIVRATGDHLDLLALSTYATRDEAELVAQGPTTDCARLIRDAYDVGLIDLGAFFDARSQVVALELVRRMELDAVIAVAGPNQIDLRDARTLAEHLERSDCQLLGAIENRIAKPQAALTTDP